MLLLQPSNQLGAKRSIGVDVAFGALQAAEVRSDANIGLKHDVDDQLDSFMAREG